MSIMGKSRFWQTLWLSEPPSERSSSALIDFVHFYHFLMFNSDCDFTAKMTDLREIVWPVVKWFGHWRSSGIQRERESQGSCAAFKCRPRIDESQTCKLTIQSIKPLTANRSILHALTTNAASKGSMPVNHSRFEPSSSLSTHKRDGV